MAVVAAAEQAGFTATGRDYPPSYRDNDRLVRDDEALASWLFARLRPSLPATVEDGQGRRWQLRGLNPRFRYCRYRGGQQFCIHQDGAWAPSPTVRSRLTCQVYLNDARGFRGGRTRYYAGRDEASGLLGVVEPEAGAAIVFDHGLWHDGEAVTEGTKYVMRTDVMYELDGPPPDEGPGHDGYVWSVLALRDGRLATGSRDCSVRLWAPLGDGWVADGRRHGHAASVIALAQDEEGALWSAARDRRVLRWDGGAPVEMGRHDGAVLCLTHLGDGRVASGGADGLVRLWPGSVTLAGHAGWVWALTALPCGRLASASEDGTLRIWTAEGRCEAVVLVGPPQRALAAGGGFLYAGDANGVVTRWASGPAWQVQARAKAHAGAVCAVALRGADDLITGGEDHAVTIRDARDLTLTSVHRHDNFVRSVAVLADGRLASASYDGSVRFWR